MSKPAEPDQALGVVVRRLRRRAGLGQQELAAGAGVTVSALSRIERGVSNPTWTTVRAIARTLRVELDEMGAAVEMVEEQR